MTGRVWTTIRKVTVLMDKSKKPQPREKVAKNVVVRTGIVAEKDGESDDMGLGHGMVRY